MTEAKLLALISLSPAETKKTVYPSRQKLTSQRRSSSPRWTEAAQSFPIYCHGIYAVEY